MKKYRNILAGPIILVLALLIGKVLSSQKAPMKRRPSAGSGMTVPLQTIEPGAVSVPVRLTGMLSAYDKAELYAEVTGVMLDTPKRLKAGHAYKKGELLLHIDDRVYKNNVLAQKSGLLNQMTQLIPDLAIDYPESADVWRQYLKNFDLNKPMDALPEPGSETERYYITSRNIYSQYYSVKSMETTLAKYAITSPFDGVVTEASLNPGSLVRSGSQVATLTGSGRYEMEAFATPKQVTRLKVGQSAVLTSEDMAGEFKACITRINTSLDASQTVRVYLETTDSRLRDGLYLTAVISTDAVENSVRLSKTLLEKGRRIYTVHEGRLHLVPVNVVAELGDDVIVTGLEAGTQIVARKIVGLKDGMELPEPAEPNAGEPGQGQGQGKGKGQSK